MSYTNDLSMADLANYEQIADWHGYYTKEKQKFNKANPALKLSQHVLKVHHKIFTDETNFAGEYEGSVEFIHCYFKGEIYFHSLETSKRISFRQCFADLNIAFLSTVKMNGPLDFSELTCSNNIIVQGGIYDECKWTFYDNPRLLLSGGEFKQLIIGYWGQGAHLKELSIDTRKVAGSIRVANEQTKIGDLVLRNSGDNCSISLEEFHVNTLSIYQFRNDKAFRMTNLKPLAVNHPSEISIYDSYMGRAEFYSMNFSAFDEVNLHDVSLVDSTFVNIQWPKKIRAWKGRKMSKSESEQLLPQKIHSLESTYFSNLEPNLAHEIDPHVITYYRRLREIYRQLKYAMSKQGDVVQEQKFHSLEMLAHNRTLDWYKSPGTKTIIKLSFILSDFGQSLTRPLTGLMIGHFLLFIVLVATGGVPGLHLDPSAATHKGFESSFHWFIKLINPLRKGEELTGFYIAIDVMMRIWSSYMVYNLIRASRRFIK